MEGLYKGEEDACLSVVIMDPKSVINLGRDFGVYHTVWHGESKIHIRQMHKYKGSDKLYAVPTKVGQGIILSPDQCLDLFASLDEVTHCLEQHKDVSVTWDERRDLKMHIGANVYVSVKDSPYVHVRRWFLPEDKDPLAANLLPTRAGVCLSDEEFAVFRARAVPYLKQNVPAIANGIRCGDKLDHQSKEGWLTCGHCNPPLTSVKWSID